MKNLKILIALLAALALVFAAGCSDDTDDYDEQNTESEGGSTDDSAIYGTDYEIENGVWIAYTEAGLLAWAEAAQKDLSTSCNLGNDITLSDEWTPIGNNDNPYTGTFDGGGHVISGLTINKGSTSYIGFFGYVGAGGTVNGLNLKDVSIQGGQYTAAIAGLNDGEITGCSSSGNISGATYTGGIAGRNYNAITGCYSIANITGSSNFAGGIAGNNYFYTSGSSGKIIGCYYSEGAIVASSAYLYVGSISGGSTNATIRTCAYSGTITANGTEKDSPYGYAYQSTTTGIVKVDDNATTWEDAMASMNSAISSSGWQYESGSGDEPLVLKKS